MIRRGFVPEVSMRELTGLAAAQYIRMSTDSQTLPPAMQKHAIQEYADASGLSVVASYEDEGRSGLTLRHRTEMRRLLNDVASDDCPFSVVLVYDVSRWGRFQDTDESAYYEYHCRLHGVEVVYVNEPFERQKTPMAENWPLR
jgi:DNA invertase Pin-like site-specific DNA recombinase